MEQRRAVVSGDGTLSNRAVAALAIVGVVGAVVCGRLAGVGATPVEEIEPQGAPLSMMRVLPVETEDGQASAGDAFGAIARTLVSYASAFHRERAIGPVRLALGTTSDGVLVRIGMFDRPMLDIAMNMSAGCGTTVGGDRATPDAVEPMLVSRAANMPRLESVSYAMPTERVEPADHDEPIGAIARMQGAPGASRFNARGLGYCPAWPDSVDYSRADARRVFLDDALICDGPTNENEPTRDAMLDESKPMAGDGPMTAIVTRA